MADRTLKDAHSIGCTNPQYLVEKIIQMRMYESKYWTEECFGLMAEFTVDKAMELMFVGGVYGGNIKPTPFLCLILKMLQEEAALVEFIKNEDFKYVCVLGALYMRLTGTVLEEAEQLEPRVSALEEDMDSVGSSEKEEEEDEKSERVPSPDHRRRSYGDLDKPRRSPTLPYRRSRSLSPRRRNQSPKRRSLFPHRERHRSKIPPPRKASEQERHRSCSKSPGSHRSHRYRSHSKSPERSRKSHRKSWRGNE
uniref:Pre-mRNA-splicing factor 38B n=1 Tax=Rhinopithecus bieti TaxID=61621 RepID=A0A2K6L9D7_RHIBE